MSSLDLKILLMILIRCYDTNLTRFKYWVTLLKLSIFITFCFALLSGNYIYHVVWYACVESKLRSRSLIGFFLFHLICKDGIKLQHDRKYQICSVCVSERGGRVVLFFCDQLEQTRKLVIVGR